jgi:hypothetical protein
MRTDIGNGWSSVKHRLHKLEGTASFIEEFGYPTTT